MSIGIGFGMDYASALNVPSLSFDWLNKSSLVSNEGFELSSVRPSNATYWGSDGLLKTANFNEARFEYNPKTLVKRGLKVEPQASNILLRSEDYSNGYWIKTDTTVSLTNEVLGIRGNTNEASKVQEGSAGNAIFVSGAPSITPNATYTCFHFVKKGNFDWIRIRMLDGATSSNGANCWFNIANGTTGNISLTGTGSSFSTYIIPISQDYYMCCITGNIGGNYNTIVTHFVSATGNGQTTRVSNGYYYLCGSQIELGNYPTSYIQTSTVIVTRSAENFTMPLGSWNNQSEGSIFCSFFHYGIVNTSVRQFLFSIDESSAAAQKRMINTFDNSELYISDTTVQVQLISPNKPLPNTRYKVSMGYKTNDVAYSLNNILVGTDNIATIPSTNILRIGCENSGRPVHGCIEKFHYYNKRLPNEILTQIT